MEIDENDFFRQVTKRICSTLDLDDALLQTFQYLQDVMPADLMHMGLYEPELGAMRVIATAPPEAWRTTNTLLTLSEAARENLKTDLPQARILDPKSDPVAQSEPVWRWLTHILGTEDISEMVMLVKVQETWLGSLALFAKGQDRYSGEHLHLFSLLNDSCSIALSNTLRYQEIDKLKDMLLNENRSLSRQLYQLADNKIIGHDSGLSRVMAMVQEVAPRESPVLLTGETGVGKDVIASMIHSQSPRRHGPFIKVNCGAIPETLLESELFGHEKGAFTGATANKRGRFERSHEGTIFLDEIGEMPLQAQVRLLRVLQEKEIERVGGSKPIKLDIRVIAASNRDLEGMIEQNLFRLDLWFRLHVFPIDIPPLRTRRRDIPALVSHFLERKARELKVYPTPVLAPGAIDRLMAYSWPGNVRELENLVERALILSKGRPLTFSELAPKRDSAPMPAVSLLPGESHKLDHVVSQHIRSVLALTKGRVGGAGGAAEVLGIHPNTLRNRMNKLGIPYGRKDR